MDRVRVKEICDITWNAIYNMDTPLLESLLVADSLVEYDVATLRYTYRVRNELIGWKKFRDETADRLELEGKNSAKILRGLYVKM